MNDSHFGTFVTTEALAENLVDHKYKIIDLREIEKFENGHIETSIHIDNSVFAHQNNEGINVLPNRETLISVLQEKGINKKDNLVLIDDVFNLNCSLAAWTLHYYDFFNVNLLDGAFAKWIKEERKLTTDISEYPSGNISFDEENESILATKDDILMNINSENILFVDNRSEYAIQFEQQGGNIPGAIHYWYLDLFKECPDYFILKNPSEILKDLKSKGIVKDKTIVVYCESAPKSALVYLVLKDLGYSDVRLYLAGYEEWRIICSFLG